MNNKILVVCFALFFCNFNRANAGLGAFLSVNNQTPYQVFVNIGNTSPTETVQALGYTVSSETPWNVNPTANGGYSMPPYSTYPSSGGQYIESNNSYSGASNASVWLNATISVGQGYQSLNATVNLSENNSSYSATAYGSNGYFSVTANAVPGSGSQWIITVTVTSLFPNYNAASWMSANPKIQDSTLFKMTIPGAHDAAMSNVIYSTTFANACNTQTQNDNFYNMLTNDGVRYFDCRPVIIDASGTNYLGHFTFAAGSINDEITSCSSSSFVQGLLTGAADAVLPIGAGSIALNNQGCAGMTLASALSQVKQYLTNTSLKNTNEVVILDFSHCMDLSCCNWDHSCFTNVDGQNLITQITDSLAGYLYIGGNFLTTPIGTITKTGSKVIVWVDTSSINGNKSGFVTGTNGVYPEPFGLPSGSAPAPPAPTMYNNYSNTNVVGTMTSGQLAASDANATSTYFALSWTLTESATQAVLCLLGSTAVQTAFNAAQAEGYFGDVVLGALAGPLYQGTLPSQALNTFEQQNPYTNIMSLAQQAVNNLYLIPQHCATTKIYPQIIFGDIMSPAQLNTVFQVNALHGY